MNLSFTIQWFVVQISLSKLGTITKKKTFRMSLIMVLSMRQSNPKTKIGLDSHFEDKVVGEKKRRCCTPFLLSLLLTQT